MSPIPRCGCADACSCLITAGSGISVEGIGTLENPYQITSDAAQLVGRVEFTDDGSVDFTTTGVGTVNDPLTVFGDVALTALSDVSATAPANGQVPVWRTDHWAWEAPAGGGGGIPSGGTVGQVLTKLSATDGDAGWTRYGSTLLTPAKPVADLASTYPTGTSQMFLTNTEAAANGWPAGSNYCQVVTNRDFGAGAAASQWCMSDTAGALFSYFRSGNSSGWGPWERVAGKYSDQAVCSSALTVAVAVSDVVGLTLPVPVTSTSSVFLVNVALDVNTLASTAATLIATLSVAGVSQNAQMIWVPTTGALSGVRAPLTQTYRLTGLAVGTTTVKVQASCGTASQFRINSTHSTMTVQQIA